MNDGGIDRDDPGGDDNDPNDDADGINDEESCVRPNIDAAATAATAAADEFETFRIELVDEFELLVFCLLTLGIANLNRSFNDCLVPDWLLDDDVEDVEWPLFRLMHIWPRPEGEVEELLGNIGTILSFRDFPKRNGTFPFMLFADVVCSRFIAIILYIAKWATSMFIWLEIFGAENALRCSMVIASNAPLPWFPYAPNGLNGGNDIREFGAVGGGWLIGK